MSVDITHGRSGHLCSTLCGASMWREQAQEFDQRLSPDAMIAALEAIGFRVVVLVDEDSTAQQDEDTEFTFADALALRGLKRCAEVDCTSVRLTPGSIYCDDHNGLVAASCDDCGRVDGTHDEDVEH